MKNLRASLCFELKLNNLEPSDSESPVPRVLSWNVTYADQQIIKASIIFNNSVYISTMTDVREASNNIYLGLNTSHVTQQSNILLLSNLSS